MNRSHVEDYSFTSMASSSNQNESRRHGTSSRSLSTTISSSSSTTASTSFVAVGTNCSTGSTIPTTSNTSFPTSTLALTTPTDSGRHVLSHINDIFKCTICFGRLDDPHLCPQCSKLYCYDCIGEWLDSGISQSCPNCKIKLQLDQLVKVRWFDDIQKLQQKLRTLSASDTEDTQLVKQGSTMGPGTESELCPMHGKIVNFYCSSCKQCICEVCATDVSEGRHRDHTFKALHVTYEQHVSMLNNELEKVEHYRDKLALLINKIDRNVALIGRVKHVKHKELEAIMVSALKGLDRQEEEKLTKLRTHQDGLLQEMEDIDLKLQTMRCEMTLCSKPELIQMKSNIFSVCNAIRMNPIKDFKQIRVQANLKIEIPHLFETGIFVVHNFSTFDDNKVYSNEFSDCLGRTWRIMAWCVIAEDHFGIYLELIDGSPCWMECTFQLIHLDPEMTISKTIRQYFDRTPQKGWGLRDFVTLTTILEKNYVRDNDSLELLYNIRPLTPIDAQLSLDADESLSEH
ncbi:E3 ubiquitin-protein ligase TRIM37-like isoform X1 [Anopheles funestus]|uniref:E3 ubiquitin-protein ligase TRIM37-like isoform X1 n=2 Tax=Anopheles funestus TaxID=62324 RepID=UPI0020C6DD69|nr:E3 ubiquitin-protein ligase TRIM37-like isoform X1 [Anopheles funestus]